MWGGLRAACSPNKVFEWTEHLEKEFVDFKNIFYTQIRLSPFDKKKPLKMLCDGASSKSIGYVLFQMVNEDKPELGCTIVSANSTALKEA